MFRGCEYLLILSLRFSSAIGIEGCDPLRPASLSRGNNRDLNWMSFNRAGKATIVCSHRGLSIRQHHLSHI